MATKVVREVTVSDKLIGRWEQICAKLAVLAEEVPANRFDYPPGEGLRTIADVLRHVAFWNSSMADTARGTKTDDKANELPKERFSTKAQVIDALKSSPTVVADLVSDQWSILLTQHQPSPPQVSQVVGDQAQHQPGQVDSKCPL